LDRGAPPSCSCGCGQSVIWDTGHKRWRAYADISHYRKPKVYKDKEWLTEQYASRTLRDIADEFDVNSSTIRRFLHKFNIQPRPPHQRRGVNTGDANHAWKGGIAQWEYSSDWKSIAREIRNRDKWTCQDCYTQRKRWGKELHVHHIDGNKFNNDPENLISLCANCHRIRHGKKEVMLV
jgi:hypothetical protein